MNVARIAGMVVAVVVAPAALGFAVAWAVWGVCARRRDARLAGLADEVASWTALFGEAR